MDVRKICRK